MKIDFPYPNYDQIAPVEVPDENLMGVYSPRAFEVDEPVVLAEGFARPIGAPRLREAVGAKDRVLILIDDGTRMTPVDRILPHVLAELSAAGVSDDRIEFLTAQGTHREMSEAELKAKLGPFFGRFKVHQHHWLKEDELHDFGTTKDGTRVTANKLLAKADFILGVGSIVPHRVKGFSGGAKIAFPGVSGREIMDRNQWEASMRMSETVMGVAENSMRLRMEEAARLAGVNYIVNVVYDIEKHIVGCFTGDVVLAHREGCRCSREVYAAYLPDRADILIIDSHSADRDFWQSAKGIYAGTLAAREGGTIILVSPNPEGVASNHPNLMRIGYRPHAELVQMAQSGKVDDFVGFAILADTAQIIDHHDCIMVSPGVKKQEAEKIGFRYAKDCTEALKMAMEKQGQHARIAVIRYGGHVLPIVSTEQLRGSEAGPRPGTVEREGWRGPGVGEEVSEKIRSPNSETRNQNE